jgi:hypothetical protein
MSDSIGDATKSTGSEFSFSWGAVSIQVSGSDDLVREGFVLLREEILPKLTGKAAQAEIEGATTAQGEEETPEPAAKEEQDRSDAPTPADFLDFKKPKTAHETATVLGYYLKTYRGAEDFTVGQMEALINEAHKPMKNMQNAIWNAGRKNFGWIKRVAGKKNHYYLTPAGENYVKTQLPKKGK